MVSFFERDGLYVRVETRERADGFELAVTHPDGRQITEVFVDSKELTDRQRKVEHVLTGEGWSGPHGRLS